MSTLMRRYWWAPLPVIALAVGGFIAWALLIPAPMPEAIAALTSDAEVTVESGRWLVFKPSGRMPGAGLILYPGGRVDPRAYAPAARAIAARNYLVVVTPMPLNLAVFAPDAARAVIAEYPGVRTWVVGGHSLGGAMGAAFAQQNPSTVRGLVLWAAYPAEANSLADSSVLAISISATRDGLATPSKVDASRRLLPPGAAFVVIEGGNHAQFAWYGAQDGDGTATITRVEQQAQIVAATLSILYSLSPPPNSQ